MVKAEGRAVLRGEKLFDAVNLTILTIAVLSILYPLWFILIASISDPLLVGAGKVWLWPKGITFEGYRQVMKYPMLLRSYRNTIFYAIAGTVTTLAFNLPAAYALSRKDLVGRGVLTAVFAFTMFFNGGLIPTFLVIKGLGMVNTVWAMIIPGATSMYTIIVCRTYFHSSLPEGLQEAARIDGCSDFGIFFRMILPLSTPIIAVTAMFAMVGHWNSYFNALIFIRDSRLNPLQIVLREILVMNQTAAMLTTMSAIDAESAARRAMLVQIIKYSLIVLSSLPVMVIYPFFQRYFVKGIMVGAIKG
jgi:putative aldouronate transport system permease protein